MASGSLKRDADTAVIDVAVIDDAAVADVSQLKVKVMIKQLNCF